MVELAGYQITIPANKAEMRMGSINNIFKKIAEGHNACFSYTEDDGKVKICVYPFSMSYEARKSKSGLDAIVPPSCYVLRMDGVLSTQSYRTIKRLCDEYFARTKERDGDKLLRMASLEAVNVYGGNWILEPDCGAVFTQFICTEFRISAAVSKSNSPDIGVKLRRDAVEVGKIIADVVMHTNSQDGAAKNAYPLLQSLFGELLKMDGAGGD